MAHHAPDFKEPHHLMHPGDRIGSYALKAKLAIGGYCEIWLATQHGPMGFERWCALKMLKQEQRDDQGARRSLMAEARLLARLDHPSVIELFEFGHAPDADQVYYSMPYISGRSLSTFMDRAAKTPYFGVAEALWIGVELLDALAYVHTRTDPSGHPLGIIHRDVSPENILITFDGHLRLIDFGIAISRLASRQTHTHTVKGKAQYLSPEQARGEQEFDRRTDIYSAGLVLFYLLSGREAFDDNLLTAIAQARNPEIPSLERIADVPRAIADHVNAMLTPNVDQRPDDARRLGRHMRALLRKFYPRYDRFGFAENVAAIFARDINDESDFLTKFKASTQIIKDISLTEEDLPYEDADDREDTSTKEIPSGHIAPVDLEERPPERGRHSSTVPDIPAWQATPLPDDQD